MGAANAGITLPQSFSVSLAHDYGTLKVLADITWTGWSSFDELRIKYDNPNQPDSVTTEDWEDVFRYSVGVDWQYSDKITLRTGIAYDETAVPSDERRTPRVPDNNRTWLSFGGTYIINPEFTVDIGYSHIFISDTKINNTFEGLNIKVVYKKHSDLITVPNHFDETSSVFDAHKNNPYSYDNVKMTFEKSHAKIINKSSYVKYDTDKNEFIFFSSTL